MTDAGVVVKDVNVALLRKYATGERLHNVGLATSGACATALPPAASLARATSWAVSSLGSATWTLPTWRARRSAVARPTPEPPPVTTATLAMPIGVVAHVFLNFFGSMGHLRCWPIGALTPHDTNPTDVRDIPWFGFCQDPCHAGIFGESTRVVDGAGRRSRGGLDGRILLAGGRGREDEGCRPRPGHGKAAVRNCGEAEPSQRRRLPPLGLLAQNALEDLAARVARQHVLAHQQILRHLEVRQRRAGVRQERLSVERRARRRHHDGADLLAHHLVRDANDGHLEHAGRGRQHVLDLDAVHVFPAAVDHVLGPVDDVGEALAVDPCQVPRAQPAVTEGLGRLLRLAPVALS